MPPSLTRRLIFALILFLATAGSARAAMYAQVEKVALNVSVLRPGDKAVVAVVVAVQPGFHTQSHTPAKDDFIPFEASVAASPAISFHAPIYPRGKDEAYPGIDASAPLNVYTGRITVYLPLDVKPDAPAGPITISGKFHYQACNDQTCFLPENLPFTLSAEVAPAGTASSNANAELFEGIDPKLLSGSTPATTLPTTPPTTNPESEPVESTVARLPAMGVEPSLLASLYSSADLKKLIEDVARGGKPTALAGSDWTVSYALWAAFLAGLLFNVMPCVLPVLPLKAVGFYEVGQHRRSRSILFGTVFSAGIIAVFAILAILVLVLRVVVWGKLFSEPWFIWPMVGVLVLMAFSLFGAFTFSLPVGAYRFEPRHDTYSGNFLLGMLTAILATPCTAPLLPPLLVWASSPSLPRVVGVCAMLMVGVGMASPYLILMRLARSRPEIPAHRTLGRTVQADDGLHAAGGGRLFRSGPNDP